MEHNYNNEMLKRKYAEYLKEAGRLSQSTIKFSLATLTKYDNFSDNEDYAKFNTQSAVEVKQYLKDKSAVSSYRNNLKRLQKFFTWLSEQKGYKSKVTKESIDYLNVSKKDEALSRTSKIRKFPKLEDIIKLAKSIMPITEIDKRDRALISLACLTGIRDSALASLPIKSINIEDMTVNQDPQYVKTKFSKHIISRIFNFDKELLQYFIDWYKLLLKKGYTETEPLFPRSKINKIDGNLCFEKATEVESKFWHGNSQIISIFKTRSKRAELEYFQPHSYRHLAAHLALKKARSGEEIKAVSQHFGHEHIATTLNIYGNYTKEDLIKKLSDIDTRTTNNPISNRKLEQIKEILNSDEGL